MKNEELEFFLFFKFYKSGRSGRKKARKILELNILRQALENSWGEDTCYPPQAKQWKNKHPSFGQCAVTALVVQDYFGGKITYCEHAHHYWIKNSAGEKIDLTAEQFGPETEICEDGTRCRQYMLESAAAKKADTFKRYLLLKSRVEYFLKNR